MLALSAFMSGTYAWTSIVSKTNEFYGKGDDVGHSLIIKKDAAAPNDRLDTVASQEYGFVISIPAKAGKSLKYEVRESQTNKSIPSSGTFKPYAEDEFYASQPQIYIKAQQYIEIFDLDEHDLYWVREEQLPGYSMTSTGSRGHIPQSGNAEATFNNVYNMFGSLKFEKLNEGDDSTKFKFSVAFDIDGSAYELPLQYTIDGGSQTNFTNDGTIEIANGQKVLFERLPVGLHYKVKETDSLGQTPSTMEWEGFVVPGDSSSLTFKNFKPSNGDGNGNGKLVVQKKLKGETPYSSKIFKFDVIIRNDDETPVTSIVPTFTGDGKETTDIYSIENNVFKITMAADDEFSFDNLPEGYTYEVLETEYGNYLPTIERLYGSFINSQQITYTFINYSLGSVNVSAYKNVKNGAKDKEFKISLYLDGALYESYNLSDGKSTGPISIPNGVYYEFVEDNYSDYYTNVKYAAGIAYKGSEAPKSAEIINDYSGNGNGNGDDNNSGSSDNTKTPTPTSSVSTPTPTPTSPSTPKSPTPTQRSRPNVTFYPTATPKASGSGDAATLTPIQGATSTPTAKQYATSTPKQENSTATPIPSSGNGNDNNGSGNDNNGSVSDNNGNGSGSGSDNNGNGGNGSDNGSDGTGTDKGNPKTLNGSADPGMWIALMLGSSVSLRFVTRRKKHLK
jgi:hypothetical protein